MRNFVVIFLVFFISCKEKNIENELELEILNNSIVSFQSVENSDDIYKNMMDSNIVNKSKTIIT